MEYAIVVLGGVALLAVLVIYVGWAFWLLWGWFMVPFGLPEISLAWAIGIVTTARILAPPPSSKEKMNNQQWTTSLLFPLVLLVIGYVAKSFM